MLPPEESAVANRGAEPAVCCQQRRVLCCEQTMCRPQQNLADWVQNLCVFNENWGVLDENLGPAGLPAWPAFPPNIIAT